jgi:hypothetical protein
MSSLRRPKSQIKTTAVTETELHDRDVEGDARECFKERQDDRGSTDDLTRSKAMPNNPGASLLWRRKRRLT